LNVKKKMHIAAAAARGRRDMKERLARKNVNA
jgi:hypothetical protein